MVKASIEAKEVNQNLSQVNLSYLLALLVTLQVGNYHEEQSVGAEASKVRVVQRTCLQKLL